MNSNSPVEARFVVLRGGAVGCSSAHASAKTGFSNILLIERSKDVGEVTASRGAGFCGQRRDSVKRVKLAMRSMANFRELQREIAQGAAVGERL